MMVSMATAVLPVWRSPMMSSRWPRPIGIMASMALMPVWSDSRTDWRFTMPGAITSIWRNSLEAMGPLPSMGWPMPSTTRPMMASPTGTSAILLVRLTMSPSRSFESSPMSTAPTFSSSRFRAMPMTPPGNSRSSPDMTLSSPKILAIPSPTVIMVPTSATSTVFSKSDIFFFMISLISCALICIAALLLYPEDYLVSSSIDCASWSSWFLMDPS